MTGTPRTQETSSTSASSPRFVSGLEAIIDAAAGILAAQSLQATLQGMADALMPIVPYTSLALYEVEHATGVLVPRFATGSWVEATLASRPSLTDSITGSAVTSGDVVCVDPYDPRLRANTMAGTEPSDAEAILIAPLYVGDTVIGTLNVWREDTNERFADEGVSLLRFSAEEAMLLRRFASLAVMAFVNSAQREQLRAQALTDELTGLYNRRHQDHCLSAALQDGRRQGDPTSVAYFDLDAFKSVNDNFGHAAGDEVLCAFARLLRQHTRAGDICCRTGGEEFTVVLPRTSAADARQLASRIADAVRKAGLGPRGNLTVSAGVATSDRSLTDPESLISQADERLMQAKRNGRDRVSG